MTIRHRARVIGLALVLSLVPSIQPARADDDNGNRSKNQKLIQSFSPYERAMYLKQQGRYADAIEILKPMAALGKGYEQAQLSLGQCYIASAETATPEARHDALVTGTKWVLASADSGFPAAQVQLIHMMLDGGRFKVEPQAAGMWYLIWKRNPAKLQAGSTDLEPALMHKLQSTLTPEDWQKAQAQADAAIAAQH
jgi:TPR repeat protein